MHARSRDASSEEGESPWGLALSPHLLSAPLTCDAPASFVGYSDNVGDPSGSASVQRWDARLGRSQPRQPEQTSILTGFKLYDGPTVIDGLVARAFPPGTAPVSVRTGRAWRGVAA